jgi:2-dehydropantoate 2-reductase
MDTSYMNSRITDKKKVHIFIVGTGAIGSYYGGRLAQAGCEVATLCRSDYEEVKQRGITIQSVKGDFHFYPAEVVQRVEDYTQKPDYIIIATKALPEITLASLIQKIVYRHTSIVFLQNGINIEEEIATHYPKNEIISGLAYICVTKIKHGVIEHQAKDRLVLGKYPEGCSSKAEQLKQFFIAAGIECKNDTTILAARWHKLVWNVPFNALSVAAGQLTTAEIMQNNEIKNLAIKIMQEIVLLAARAGYPMAENIISDYIDFTKDMPPYKTSMLVDYEHHKQMEVEAILGNALHIARQKKLDIPYTETLYILLSSLNQKLVS